MFRVHRIFRHHSIRMIVGVVSAVFVGIISISRFLPFSAALRAVLGTTTVILLPGLILSYVFFQQSRSVVRDNPDDKESKPALDWIERLTLSFVLSLSVVPLLIFVTNRLGLPIMPLTVGMIIGLVILLGLLYLVLRHRRKPSL